MRRTGRTDSLAMCARFLAGAALVFLAAACAAADRVGWPVHLRFLTGPNGGQWHAMGEPIADALAQAVLPTSSRTGGGLSNIEAVDRKAADIAFTLGCFLGAFESGEEEYRAARPDNVAVLANVYPQVLYVLVREDFAEERGIETMGDLLSKSAGMRFASLKPGTASEFILAVLLKYGYETDFEKLAAAGWDISFADYAEIADNLVAGDLDCFAYTAGTDVPLIHTIEEHIDVRILPIERDVLGVLSAKFRINIYEIAPGQYRCAQETIPTLGDYTCIVVRKDFPDDLAAAIARTLWKSRDEIAAVVADFGALSPETALPDGLFVHPGARRFWETVRLDT